MPSRIVITECQPPAPRFSIRPSTETSASAAETKTRRPRRSSTLRASACVAMHDSLPGIRSHESEEVRPSDAAARREPLAMSATMHAPTAIETRCTREA